MKLNQSFHLCYVFCLGVVLFVQPVQSMKNCEEGLKDPAKKQERVEKSIALKNSEVLHSELLFR